VKARHHLPCPWQSKVDADAGWTKSAAVDMGPMGIYQLFAINGEDKGGMMTKPPHILVATWGYYFNVAALDAALGRLTKGKGKPPTWKRSDGSKQSITLTKSWGILMRALLTISNWRASAPRRGEASGVRQQQAQQPSY